MKTHRINETRPNKSANGLTLVEVLVSIVVVALLAALLLPVFGRARPRTKAINCVSNVKQVGLAFLMWSGDHEEKFPWQVSTTNGGTLEFAGRAEVYRHLLAVSNELTSPKVLACSADKKVTRVSDWTKFNDAHLSYFVGLDAREHLYQSILTGDRNITTNGEPAVGAVAVTSNTVIGFTPEMHRSGVNIGLGDGSAHQVTANSFSKQVQAALLSTNAGVLRFSIPKPN